MISAAFENLPKLAILYLGNNELTSFEDAMVYYAPHMSTLSLLNNLIQDVDICKLKYEGNEFDISP